MLTQNSTSLQPNLSTATAPLLTFTVAGQLYGVPVDRVIRIIEMVTITHLPEAPATIRGLINLHGYPVLVMDMHTRFGLPPVPYGLHTPIVLVDAAPEGQSGRPLGLVVDSVEQVVELPTHNLQPPSAAPNAAAEQQAAYLRGVAKIDRQILLLLSIPALLRPAEQTALAAVLAEG